MLNKYGISVGQPMRSNLPFLSPAISFHLDKLDGRRKIISLTLLRNSESNPIEEYDYFHMLYRQKTDLIVLKLKINEPTESLRSKTNNFGHNLFWRQADVS